MICFVVKSGSYVFRMEMAARTAALSRYLAALDTTADNHNSSVQSVQSPPPITSSVSDFGPDENEPFFEANFSSDLYNGHKVVAMPSSSLGGMSVREVVTSRNGSTVEPRRSRSTGRSAPLGRDLVQDVYDRMGVSREDLSNTDRVRSRPGEQPMSADKFHERYRAAAALSTAATVAAAAAAAAAAPRGRTLEHHQTDGNRRARSLSRGRKISGLWPPANPVEGGPPQTAPNDKPTVESPPRLVSKPLVEYSPEPVNTRTADPTPKVVRNTYSSGGDQSESSSMVPRSAYNSAGEPVTLRKSQPQPPRQMFDDAISEAQSAPEMKRTPSVKDRITAFAGTKTPSSSTKNYSRNYSSQQYTKRDHPPQIDIFEGSRRQEDSNNSQDDDAEPGMAPPPSNVPPSPAAAAAADAAAELVRRQNQSKKFGRKATTADTYLASVNSRNAQTAPITEIAAADESGGVVDMNSVAMSSVSCDEYGSPPSKRDGTSNFSKRPAWADRGGGYLSLNSGSKSARKVGASPAGGNISADTIERLVDERVRARVAELEAKFESQMGRLENRLDERMNGRMGALEGKIDKIELMLTELVRNSRQAEI